MLEQLLPGQLDNDDRAEHLSRRGIQRGFYVNLLLLALMIAGVALSFRCRRTEAV